MGNRELLGSGVCSGDHSLACSVERGQVVHPEVVMLEGRVLEEED